MSVHLNLHANHHGTARISARALTTKGAPLILEITEETGKPEDAEAFAERFGGERVPVTST
jgi:hypothetical protein